MIEKYYLLAEKIRFINKRVSTNNPLFVVNGALVFMGHKDTKYDLKIIFIINMHIALWSSINVELEIY